MDFEKLDETVRTSLRQDRLRLIGTMGYKYISEAIFDQYYVKKKTVTDIAKSLNYSNKQHIYYLMKRYGFTTLSDRGGNRKNLRLNKPEARENILSLKGVTSLRKAAKICGCSSAHVYNVWKNAS
jgi:hypothetical protein